MAIFFTATDNHDGTVTYQWENDSIIFESLVSVYRWAVSGAGQLTRVSDYFGVNVAAGSETVAVPNGIHIVGIEWWDNAGGGYHTSIYNSEAPNILLRVDDGEKAREERCRDAVIDTIKLLALPEIGNRVLSQLTLDETDVPAFPCVICSEIGVQETDEQGLSTRDDVGYPVKVEICDRGGHRDHKRLGFYEMTRQRIMDAFRNQQLMGVDESKICRIEPYVVVDPDATKYEFVVSAFVIRCVLRHGRGIS